MALVTNVVTGEVTKHMNWPELCFDFVELVVFSACGGIRSGSKLPVLTAYFLVLT